MLVLSKTTQTPNHLQINVISPFIYVMTPYYLPKIFTFAYSLPIGWLKTTNYHLFTR